MTDKACRPPVIGFCGICKKVIYRYPSTATKNNFCSKKCYGKWVSKTTKGENCKFWKGGPSLVRCETCKKKYKVRKYRIKKTRFCSAKCRYAWQRTLIGPLNPSFIHGDISLSKRISEEKRRSQKLNNSGSFCIEEWEFIKEMFYHLCPSCGTHDKISPLTIDHILPLSKGGLHALHNIQPLCRSCNSSKGRNRIIYVPL